MQKPLISWIKKTQLQLILPQQLHQTHKNTLLGTSWLELGTSCNSKITPWNTNIELQQDTNKTLNFNVYIS